MAVWHEEYELYRKYIHNISRFYKQHEEVRAYLELGLSLGSIIIFLSFAIRPTVVTITEKVREMQSKQQVVEKLTAKIDSLSKANALLQENKDVLDKLETAVPDEAFPEDYIIQVDALVLRNNVSLEGMSLEDTSLLGKGPLPEEEKTSSESNSIKWFPFTVSVSGSFEDLSRFLDAVEKLRRPIKIESASMEETLTSGLKMTVKGQIPYFSHE